MNHTIPELLAAMRYHSEEMTRYIEYSRVVRWPWNERVFRSAATAHAVLTERLREELQWTRAAAITAGGRRGAK